MKKSFKKLAVSALIMSLCIGMLSTGNIVSKAEETAAEDNTTVPAGIAITEEFFVERSAYFEAQTADMAGNNDGYLTADEAATVESLSFFNDVANLSKYLEVFTAVNRLTVSVGDAKSIAISSSIKSLFLETTSATAVDITGGTNLKEVTYRTEGKGTLNLKSAKGYSKIDTVHVYGEKITNVVLPNQANLKAVDVSSTGITKLDVSKCKKLTSLQCYYGKLKKLNISANKNLKEVSVGGNKLTSLDISKNKKLVSVVAFDNKIKSINTKKNTKLDRLDMADNKLKTIDTSKNTKLTNLNVSNNTLKKLDVSKNKKLVALMFNNNKISKLKTYKKNVIETLAVGDNKLKSFSLAKYKKATYFDVGSSYTFLKKVGFNEKMRLCISLSKKKSHNLKKYLPKMKSCTFENEWGESVDFTLTPAGALTFTKYAHDLKYTAYGYLSIKKGDKTMSLIIKY